MVRTIIKVEKERCGAAASMPASSATTPISTTAGGNVSSGTAEGTISTTAGDKRESSGATGGSKKTVAVASASADSSDMARGDGQPGTGKPGEPGKSGRKPRSRDEVIRSYNGIGYVGSDDRIKDLIREVLAEQSGSGIR